MAVHRKANGETIWKPRNHPLYSLQVRPNPHFIKGEKSEHGKFSEKLSYHIQGLPYSGDSLSAMKVGEKELSVRTLKSLTLF